MAKRGKRDDALSLKATVISIFLSDASVEMVKCSRYQRLQRAYIIDPDHPSSYSGYAKDKVKYDSVGLSVPDAIRLSGQIKEAELSRRSTKAKFDRSFREFSKA